MSSNAWDTGVLEGQLFKNLTKYSLYLQKLSTASQVTKLAHIINKEHQDQQHNLDRFIQESQSKHNRAIRSLELQRTDLTSTLSQYHSCLTTVANSNVAAKAINDDIVAIDNEDKLIKRTLQFVQGVSVLKNNVSVIHAAIESRDYQLAARCIHEIRQLPQEILESQFARRVVPTSDIPEEPAAVVEKWCNELTEVYKSSFLEAAKSQDIQQLTLIFKTFPLVGQNTLGLDLYSKYVCDMIAEQSRRLMTMETKKRGVFAQALLHLFKIVSTIINDHSKVIASCYGTSYMIHVMEKVEKEADLQAGLVFDIFNETRKIDRVVKDIQNWNSYRDEQSEENGGELHVNTSVEWDTKKPDTLSLGDLSDLVNEFSSMLQNWSMYSRFFSVRWYEFLGSTEMSTLKCPPPIADSQLTTKLGKDGFYQNFEILVQHYLLESFKKSLSMEELPSINNLISLKPIEHTDIFSYPVSSILDDLSLLIRKNLILAVNTGQVEIFSHFLDQLAKFYQNEFLVKFMQSKFKSLQPRLSSSLSLKKFVPKSADGSAVTSRAASPSVAEGYAAKLGFNFRGAAASALTNIQSNLQAVVSDEESVLSLHQYLIYINTLYLNSNVAHRLLTVEILEENPKLLPDNYPFNDDAEVLAKKINTCETLFIKQTTKLQRWSVKFLFENILMSKVRSLTTNIMTNGNENQYISGADDYDDLTIVHEFVNKWQSMMIPYENVLVNDAFTELLSLIVDCIVKKLEQKIWTLQVNDLGATKLDRELSLLISTVCSRNYVLREKFAKVTQIALILGFDDDDFDVESGDLKEEISIGINWVLSSQDRISARNLKVDKRR